MTDYIQKKHGSTRAFILNFILVGLFGALLIQAISILFYTVAPASYFIEFKGDYEITGVCIAEDGGYALQATIHREIYPYLPDHIQKQRTVKAEAQVEITRAGREIDRFSTGEYTYQWLADDTAYIENELNVILLPGRYQATAYIDLLLPYGVQKETIIRSSNFFNVPDRNEIKKCDE